MSLKLTVDEGNSSAKITLWEGSDMVRTAVCPTFRFSDLSSFLPEDETLSAAIFSSVRGARADRSDSPFPVIRLTAATALPFSIDYDSPETLGPDRIAAAAGARVVAGGAPVLIVDIGTAVTYDFLSADAVFEGGAIAPGIDLRLKSLAEHTASLPSVDPDGSVRLCAKSTAEAMRSGAILGIAAEIEFFASRLKASHPELLTVITGGSAKAVTPFISSPFIEEPDLVSVGLKYILDYNETL